ncbi:hypothetical protein [Williamsoniiplasma lucivorax]|nr:hypothetical protein [Williamsoniiplasma lucivorax]
MSMKNQTSYANNDPELKNKWDQENFFIKIDKNLIKEINLIQSTILIRYFQKRLKVKLKKYEQKNAKMQNLHKPDKQIESFLCYLRIYAVFINFMGWNSINTIYINQKEVNIDQMKQAIIENFFYFKNYNSEKKII